MNISNFKHITTGQSVFGASGKYTHSQNTYMSTYDPDLNDIVPSFNAIEIDWNGYQVDSKYGVDSGFIDTTEDLFTYIKGLVNDKASSTIKNHYTPSATNVKEVKFGDTSVTVDAKGHIVG